MLRISFLQSRFLAETAVTRRSPNLPQIFTSETSLLRTFLSPYLFQRWFLLIYLIDSFNRASNRTIFKGTRAFDYFVFLEHQALDEERCVGPSRFID